MASSTRKRASGKSRAEGAAGVAIISSIVTACWSGTIRGAGPDLGPSADAASNVPGSGGAEAIATDASAGISPAADESKIGCSNRGPSIVFCIDFDTDPVGKYTPPLLMADFVAPSFSSGVEEKRVSIVRGNDPRWGRSLRVLYLKGGFGPDEGGALWRLDLGRNYEELYLSYWVQFDLGFDFVKGGKLPGLVGGQANSGGDKPDGLTGSVRAWPGARPGRRSSTCIT